MWSTRKLNHWIRTSAILLVTLVSYSIPSSANFVGNDTSNFNPALGGLGFVTVNGSDVLLPGFVNMTFFTNKAKNSLPPSIDDQGDLIASQNEVIFSEMSVAYGVAKNLEFGLSLSFLSSQTVDQVESGAQFSGTGLNEIRLQGKYSLLKNAPVGAALIASANINEAEDNPFVGQGSGATLNLEGVVDAHWGAAALALNLGYRFRSHSAPIPDSVYEPLGDQVIGSAGASYEVKSLRTKLISEIFAAKLVRPARFVSSEQISSEAILGVKLNITQQAAIHLGGGRRVSDGLFTPDWRAYVGLDFMFDLLHEPPSPTESNRLPVKVERLQPTVVQVQKVYVSRYYGYLPQDITSLTDQSFDKISKTHEFRLRTHLREEDLSADKPPFEIVRLEDFDFDFGSSKIRSSDYPQLDLLARYIASEPKVIKIRVEGHTDSIGSPERNRKRSLSRAQSVQAFLREALVAKGVQESIQIEAEGFGSDRPIADNATLEGGRKNRRVEIRILRQLPPLPEGSQ